MKFREWLSDNEGSSSHVRVEVEKDPIGGGYFGSFHLSDGHNLVSFDFDVDTVKEKTQVIHDIRRLKRALNDFYNAIKSIPDEELKGE
jgi:hypothetical protein